MLRNIYVLCQKSLQVKVVKDSVSYKKVSGCVCLSPLGVKLGGFDDKQTL